MAKLEDFLKDKKIDARRLLAVSKRLEALRPEDRAIRLARRNKGAEEPKKEGEETEAPKKLRSGRPVTVPTLNRALKGESISGAAKARILRAVNQVLAQKKQSEVEPSALF